MKKAIRRFFVVMCMMSHVLLPSEKREREYYSFEQYERDMFYSKGEVVEISDEEKNHIMTGMFKHIQAVLHDAVSKEKNKSLSFPLGKASDQYDLILLYPHWRAELRLGIKVLVVFKAERQVWNNWLLPDLQDYLTNRRRDVSNVLSVADRSVQSSGAVVSGDNRTNWMILNVVNPCNMM